MLPARGHVTTYGQRRGVLNPRVNALVIPKHPVHYVSIHEANWSAPCSGVRRTI